MTGAFPQFATQLFEPCIRRLVARMLRNSACKLEITADKKDKGVHKVYVYDAWADPMLVQIGQ